MQRLIPRGKAVWWLIAASLILLLALAATLFLWNYVHDSRLKSLYEQAVHGTPSNIHSLAAFRDDRIPAMLSVISTDKDIAPTVRAAAIDELWRNRWEQSGECVLVDWGEPFAVVDATLRGLKSRNTVSDYCVKQMLRYKQYGAHDYPSKADAPHRSDAQEAALAAQMDDLLRSVPETTTRGLQEMYALGSDHFNDFALAVAVELRLSAACSLVRSSKDGLTRRLGYTPKQVKEAEVTLCATRTN